MPRRKRPNPQSEENIRRIDTKPRAKKQTHGFQVHFLRGDRVVTRMFSDNVFGGKQAARRAARKFKQSMLRRLPRRKFLGGYTVRARNGFSADTLSRILEIPARNRRVWPTSSHQSRPAQKMRLSQFHTC